MKYWWKRWERFEDDTRQKNKNYHVLSNIFKKIPKMKRRQKDEKYDKIGR
jgi:hypothetical protein